jgi:4-amino-4-deoxy-L-arabinose transferase-like glycosyltransferase
MKRTIAKVCIIVVLVLAVWLRIHDLRSDAYPRLSWSSALLTDEGFYMHNARNVVLYGHAQVDGFNNMLIMPWLHYLQIAVFRRFGVGVVQDRWISIVASLMALPLFWFAMLRAFGRRAAAFGTLFMALDHSWLLYNRLALMDTPGALVLVAAWACWEYSRGDNRIQQITGLFFCGFILGLEYGVRGLGALVWPAPFLALAVGIRRDEWKSWVRSAIPIAVGMALALLVYGFVWWRPYHKELARVDKYYVGYQLLPHSLRQLGFNFDSAWFYWENGLLGYLVKHTPVMIVAIVGCCYLRRTSRTGGKHHWHPTTVFLTWWILSLLSFFSLVNYAPSRYYVLMYPALFALAAVSIDDVAKTLLTPKNTTLFLATAASVWVLTNVYWYQDWLRHITYRQWRADAWLGVHLPAEAVVFGDIANGLCMNNRLLPVSVMNGLCNYNDPLSRYRSHPEYVLILDGRWKERWWVQHYPTVVTQNNRIHAFNHVLRRSFVLGLYKVPFLSSPSFVTSKAVSDNKNHQ